MEYILTRSQNKNKKYALKIIPEQGRTKTINFGQQGYQDYTLHKDKERMERYTKRHKNEKDKGLWKDVKKNLEAPSYWAKNLLWNDKTPNMNQAIKDIEMRQKIKIKKSL